MPRQKKPLPKISIKTNDIELLGILEQLVSEIDGNYRFDWKTSASGHRLLEMDESARREVVLAAIATAAEVEGAMTAIRRSAKSDFQLMTRSGWNELSNQHRGLCQICGRLLRAKLGFTVGQVEQLVKSCNQHPFLSTVGEPVVGVFAAAKALGPAALTQDPLRKLLQRMATLLSQSTYSKSSLKLAREISEATEGETDRIPLDSSEPWADGLLNDLQRLSQKRRVPWIRLLQHASDANTAKPTAAWQRRAREVLQDIDTADFSDRVMRCFKFVEEPIRPTPRARGGDDDEELDFRIGDRNSDVLRGLCWYCAELVPTTDLCRSIARLCEISLKKIPGIGPRCPKLAYAAVYFLGAVDSPDAVGQLARLKVRTRFRTTLQQIDKALDASAKRTGITREDLEELSVPSFGLEAQGKLRQQFGSAGSAELRINGREVVLRYLSPAGKPVKNLPPSIRREFAGELADLRVCLKDMQQMLVAQRDRIDSMFLLQKTWAIRTWRERYLDHPLIGTIARRLIWLVDDTPAVFVDGVACDINGKPLTDGTTAEITLWHPVGRSVAEVTGWRRRLEELQITQPFKQAHREVYLLTGAERKTRTYSNRFAAHIIRQHQFNALCAARGWRNRLRLMVDDTYPPATKLLQSWDLRAEFWIEGIGDDFGVDSTEAGAYLRLTTDQVRFYRAAAAENRSQAGTGRFESEAIGRGERGINSPLPLQNVPPLVFSEIMRDVDLFVGVASVGNDPNWSDGGGRPRFRAYWYDYSFGDLSATANTRREVLQRIVPRLKIAERCNFTDKFLVVRGALRTYKIHLGSGNILMEPNDEYLCIVPDQRARAVAGKEKLFLPFEGDNTLSIILSKAFMLADDAKISDSSIVSQIRGTR